MNLTWLIFSTSTFKRQIYVVMFVLSLVLILPILAVLSLGTSTLSILSSIAGDNASENQVGLYQGPTVAGDNYAWENCTYWVYYLRKQANDPIPTTWGNAATWATRAVRDGFLVNKIPAVGAIMQISDVANGLGHVAYVTNVDQSNGTWTISEMNVKGLDIIDSRTYSIVAASNFNFIHDK